jgi:hypothetical protein
MKTRMKLAVAAWPAAILFVALLLLPLWLDRTPMFVQLPVALLVLGLGIFSAASAMRNRWHWSKSSGQFVDYYFRLVAVAIAILVAAFLLCWGAGRWFFP